MTSTDLNSAFIYSIWGLEKMISLHGLSEGAIDILYSMIVRKLWEPNFMSVSSLVKPLPCKEHLAAREYLCELKERNFIIVCNNKEVGAPGEVLISIRGNKYPTIRKKVLTHYKKQGLL